MEDMGEEVLKNMAQPVHIHRATPLARQAAEGSSYKYAALALPDERSIAVLSFQNVRGDPVELRACPCLSEMIEWCFTTIRPACPF